MRRTILIIGLLIISFYLQAQHFLEAGMRGGIASWSAQTNYVSAFPNVHAGIEIAYAYRSPQVVGLRTGLTIDRHQTAFGRNNYEDTYRTLDVDNQIMQVDYTIGRLREKYTVWSVGIPLQLGFSWDNFNLYIGPKIVFPLSGTWNEQADNAALSVYYPDYNNRIYEAFPLAASQHFSETNKGTMTLPFIQWWIATEVNYSLLVKSAKNHRSYIQIGVYFDYALTHSVPEYSSAESLIMLSDTRYGFPLQRMLTPILNGNRQGQTLINHYTLFDVGIKISYALSPYDRETRQKSFPCRCLPFSR